LEYFLKAIPLIIKHIPHFKALLIVARDDSARFQYVSDLVKKLKISDFVIFHDSVAYKDLRTYILMSDVTVVPSLAEGFGFAAAEVSAL
jgi:glycosyltransferase involved in cell wall biosynthesis